MVATLTAVSKDEKQSEMLGSEIHMRMCVVCVMQNVTKKSIVNQWVQRFKMGQTRTSNTPPSGKSSKRKTQCGMLQASTNSSIDTKNA